MHPKGMNRRMNRRDVLRALGAVPILASGAGLLPEVGCRAHKAVSRQASAGPHRPAMPVVNHPSNFDTHAVSLLDEVRERAAHYFVDRAHPETGIVYDRAPANGQGEGAQYATGSIAATGFGLSALCVAAEHHYLSPSLCEQRILRTLDFVANHIQHEHGFLPHYLQASSGAVEPESEFSSIDTALFLAGALHARRFLNSSKADALAWAIYARVDWPWMLDGHAGDPGKPGTLCMGWLPKSGFLQARWDSYSECMLMYLMAIGSPTHPLPAQVWQQIQRNTFDYGGIRFISSFGALFIHQYPHVWLDLRGLNDGHANYFENSISAIRAHKTWCMLQHGLYPWVDERVWGFSASDTPHRSYAAWAAPPVVGSWDGTLAPHAAGGSLPLIPEECIVVLMAMREHHPSCFQKYGFVNSFNPGEHAGKGWFDTDVIAADLALIMLMAENQQTGSVRSSFMRNTEIVAAMQAVGLRRV